MIFTYFIFNDTATTEIYTLSLHDALPIYDHAKQIRASREFFLPRAVADFVDRHRRLDAESFSQTAHERGAGRGYRFSVDLDAENGKSFEQFQSGGAGHRQRAVLRTSDAAA